MLKMFPLCVYVLILCCIWKNNIAAEDSNDVAEPNWDKMLDWFYKLKEDDKEKFKNLIFERTAVDEYEEKRKKEMDSMFNLFGCAVISLKSRIEICKGEHALWNMKWEVDFSETLPSVANKALDQYLKRFVDQSDAECVRKNVTKFYQKWYNFVSLDHVRLDNTFRRSLKQRLTDYFVNNDHTTKYNTVDDLYKDFAAVMAVTYPIIVDCFHEVLIHMLDLEQECKDKLLFRQALFQVRPHWYMSKEMIQLLNLFHSNKPLHYIIRRNMDNDEVAIPYVSECLSEDYYK